MAEYSDNACDLNESITTVVANDDKEVPKVEVDTQLGIREKIQEFVKLSLNITEAENIAVRKEVSEQKQYMLDTVEEKMCLLNNLIQPIDGTAVAAKILRIAQNNGIERYCITINTAAQQKLEYGAHCEEAINDKLSLKIDNSFDEYTEMSQTELEQHCKVINEQILRNKSDILLKRQRNVEIQNDFALKYEDLMKEVKEFADLKFEAESTLQKRNLSMGNGFNN